MIFLPAILFYFLTNFSKSILPFVKVTLYHKTGWDSINSSLSNQLTILQDQILDLTSSEKADHINIINNAATILTNTFLIYSTIFLRKLLNLILVYRLLFNYS